jgi:hypothetical protein
MRRRRRRTTALMTTAIQGHLRAPSRAPRRASAFGFATLASL